MYDRLRSEGDDALDNRITCHILALHITLQTNPLSKFRPT